MKIKIGDVLQGPIIVTNRGKGFFNVEKNLSLEIPENLVNKAFDGDKVEIRVTSLDKGQNGDPQGEVISIIERRKDDFVGTTRFEGEILYVKPDNHRMYTDFIIKDFPKDIVPNTKVLVHLLDWPEGDKFPIANVIKVIGLKGIHEVEMQSIILDQGFETGFPTEVEKEARGFEEKWEEILEREIPNRRDMRGVTTCTIDPFDAKDFDDALSIKKLENSNYEIGIHIADVSFFVKPQSELDKEAFDRSFSVYLVDRTIPMLPEALSNDLCSLKPDVPRLSFSTIFEITPEAKVISEWYGKTIIKSDRRFSYEEAQGILDTGSGDLYDELNTLNIISKKLGVEKMKNGAIRFEKEEFKFELDQNGVPISIHKKEHIDTHSLIEEFMLLSNRSVAKYIYDTEKKLNNGREGHLMYRVHNVPDVDKLKDLSEFLKVLGYKLEIKKDGGVSPYQLNDLLDSVKDKPEEDLVSSATIKTMSKALYSTENEGHFGLSFEYYTHFTSPIRRYPDLIVHRILERLLKNEKITSEEMVYFKKSAEQSSKQEAAAQDAERQSVRYKQVEFMMNHIGEEFNGIISGVAKFGLFVTIEDTGASGMVHISNLGEDYYTYDQKNYCITGDRTKNKFTLGDQVRVKILEANLDEKQLQLKLISKKTEEDKAVK